MHGYALSVIVPVYNHMEYARECLESVAAQLPSDAELVVIDDGSDLETRAMLRGYERLAENISVHYAPHGGVSSARNAGIAAAHGDYLCFLDCDDRMLEGSIAAALELLKTRADLYICGFAVSDETGPQPCTEHRTLEDRYYASVSDFADAYIRQRHLLIYSQCNKLYRRCLLTKHQILTPEDTTFGEDRLFNFEYLKIVRDVVTSGLELFCYIRRPGESLSSRHIPDYFRKITALNQVKTDTFLQLSQGTTLEEQKAFIGQNYTECITAALERFDKYPEEQNENLPVLNALAFGPAGLRLWSGEKIPCTADVLLVLGCTWYELRAEAALNYGRGKENLVYVVTGGNPVHDSLQTEAEAMRDYLTAHGVPGDQIICETEAKNTVMNLEKSWPILRALSERIPGGIQEIGVVTEGYHENYVRWCMEHSAYSGSFAYALYPCFGIWINPEKWFRNASAIRNVLYNIRRIYVSEYLETHGMEEESGPEQKGPQT